LPNKFRALKNPLFRGSGTSYCTCKRYIVYAQEIYWKEEGKGRVKNWLRLLSIFEMFVEITGFQITGSTIIYSRHHRRLFRRDIGETRNAVRSVQNVGNKVEQRWWPREDSWVEWLEKIKWEPSACKRRSVGMVSK